MKFNGQIYQTNLPDEYDEKYANGLYDLAYSLYNYTLWLEKHSDLDEGAKVCEIYYALQSLRDEVKGV